MEPFAAQRVVQSYPKVFQDAPPVSLLKTLLLFHIADESLKPSGIHGE